MSKRRSSLPLVRTAMSYFQHQIKSRPHGGFLCYSLIMLEHEYKAQQDKVYNVRSWPVTITAIILSALIIIGIVATLRYVGHDLYIVLTIILPMTITAILFALIALDGRKKQARDILDSIISLIYFWR